MIKIVKESLVTDYLSSDDLHKIMHNPEFGSFSSYQQMDGMIVRTDKSRGAFDGAPGAIKSRYWKFIKNDDGNWEVYEVDNDGRKIGSPFLAESRVQESGFKTVYYYNGKKVPVSKVEELVGFASMKRLTKDAKEQYQEDPNVQNDYKVPGGILTIEFV